MEDSYFMYVCVCNAVTEDDVLGCLADGASSAKEVRAACGMKPGCGSCTKRLCSLVSRWRTASDFADAITGGPLLPLEVVRPSVAESGRPEMPERPVEPGAASAA